MLILIDGYNVLKYAEKRGAYTYKTFINTLNLYGTKKGHTIRLIFDGGESFWKSEQRIDHIFIIHVGKGVSADDYIVQQIEQGNFKNISLFVSSDGALAREVAAQMICL